MSEAMEDTRSPQQEVEQPLLINAAEIGSSDRAAAPLNHRSLYGVPQFAADFEEEYDERASQWFELFIDLVLVVAWSNVTDALYEREESEGSIARSLFTFWLTMNLVQSGWLFYVHYQTRFIDESFLHTLQVFVFILGLAGMAIHVGEPELATELSVSMLVQKAPLILMYSTTALVVKRARRQMTFMACTVATSAAICAAVVYTEPREYTPFVICAWTLVVALEFPSVLTARFLIPKHLLVPINIDHIVDRTNAFIMICLGECLVSAMIKYGSLPSEARSDKFYFSMSFVLLMAFSIGLLYYNVQPPREASAFRRSELRGFLVYFTTCFLGPCILLVSVGVKHSMGAVLAAGGSVTASCTWMLFGSLALVLHMIFWLRVGHYWGIEPQVSDPRAVKKVIYLWWAVFALWPLVPIVTAAIIVAQKQLDPVWNLGLASGTCLGLAVVETGFTTVLASMST